MCLGSPPRPVIVKQPEPIKPPPMPATPPPPPPVPTPEKVEKEKPEGDLLIRSKKKTAKKIEKLKAGVKEFSAISGDVPDEPDQGITPPSV